MRDNLIVVGGIYETNVGDHSVTVRVTRVADTLPGKHEFRKFVVQRVDNGSTLPKPRSARMLRESDYIRPQSGATLGVQAGANPHCQWDACAQPLGLPLSRGAIFCRVHHFEWRRFDRHFRDLVWRLYKSGQKAEARIRIRQKLIETGEHTPLTRAPSETP